MSLARDASIKLVIWDLDETFWRGTLSEEGVELDASHIETVRALNRRGIVNSISSKNDLAAAEAILREHDVWDEFVFASIAWEPKGAQIARTVEAMGLRAENVLFLDDNVGNLREAEHYSAGLHTAGPEIIPSLLDAPQLRGKDDRSLSRLNQYRLLEQKRRDQATAEVTNDEFLRSCDIRVRLSEPVRSDVPRIAELMNRTNQLNYTKRRLDEREVRQMLDDTRRTTRLVEVRDRYGDYGICGLYSLLDGNLVDFVFSCRILHMGVEQWLYDDLGAPPVQIVGDVATPLARTGPIDWIVEVSGFSTHPSSVEPPNSNAPVLLKGGCDLWLLHDFLHGSIDTEFTTAAPGTGHDRNGHHTSLIRQTAQGVFARHSAVLDRLPFLDYETLNTQLLAAPDAYGTIVYSLLLDYSQGLYQLKNSDLLVPYGQFDEVATDPSMWPYYVARWGDVGITEDFLRWFRDHFDFVGPLTASDLQDNLRWLASRIPPGTRLVLLNGAEVAFPGSRERDRHLHHRAMNKAVDAMADDLDNVFVVDVRRFASHPHHFTDGIRHYTRPIYKEIADAVREVASGDLRVETRELHVRATHLRRRLQSARRRLPRW